MGRGLWEGVYRSEEDGIVFELKLYSQYILNSRVGVPDKSVRKYCFDEVGRGQWKLRLYRDGS